jgi:hypothetical protein
MSCYKLVSCAAIVAAALSGCALRQPARPLVVVSADAQTPSGVQCRMERITGSLVATRMCTTPEQRDLMRRRVQRVQDDLNRSPAALCPAGVDCVGGK